jgi:hypothetical protein
MNGRDTIGGNKYSKGKERDNNSIHIAIIDIAIFQASRRETRASNNKQQLQEITVITHLDVLIHWIPK